ncbi:MAG: MarR family winged helix-turn-helix transcriptional regulator [bacterium]
MPSRPTAKKPALKGSRYSSAEASPGYMFWRCFHAWQRQMRASLDPIGVTQVQYSILATTSYLTSTSDAVSQQDVANQLAMDKMMVSDVVKTLEARALLSRTRSATDARSFALAVTRQGRDLLKRATPAAEGVDEDFFGVLTAADRRHLIDYLARLDAR